MLLFIFFAFLSVYWLMRDCQNCFLKNLTKKLRKKLSCKNYLSNNFQTSVETFRNFVEVFSTELSNLQYTSPGEHFEEKFCFLKKIIYYRTLIKKTLARFPSFFWSSCQNWILRVWTTILKKKTFFQTEFFHHFQILSGIFSAFSRSFADCLVKPAF